MDPRNKEVEYKEQLRDQMAKEILAEKIRDIMNSRDMFLGKDRFPSQTRQRIKNTIPYCFTLADEFMAERERREKERTK